MVRYVGKANNVSQRYRAHLNKARDHQTHKRNWVNSLKKLGLKPIIEVIDIVPIERWIFWETYWISQMKTWGFDLVNNTLGGDGSSFGNLGSFKKGQGGKKVIGYNSTFEKVYDFDTAEDATKFIKTHRSSIPRCASGKSKTIKKIAWFYYENIINLEHQDLERLIKKRFDKEIKPNSGYFKKGDESLKKQKVILIELNTNKEIIFNSGTEAAKFLKVNQSAISWALKNNKIIKKQFKIKRYE
jgi:hypothetical protein